jgi:hypothetical protein
MKRINNNKNIIQEIVNRQALRNDRDCKKNSRRTDGKQRKWNCTIARGITALCVTDRNVISTQNPIKHDYSQRLEGNKIISKGLY